MGTPLYMSPEQCLGVREVDARTDVYSLGATLYELLTLRPIFDGTDRQTLLHQIMHEEPRPPRSAVRTIPPELETIILKAVAKVPADRYATARDFADDLHRFLRDEPIRARRATAMQRARKWLRRHPSVVIAGIVSLVLLAAGSSVSTFLVRRAYEREAQRAREAEERFELARRSADEMIQISEQELADKPHLENLRKRLLETALSYYQEFIELRRGDPSAQAELEGTRDRVRKIIGDLAVLQGAGQFFLLNDPLVLDELHLSDEQREELTALRQQREQEREEMFDAFHRLSSEEKRQNFVKLARANEEAVRKILKTEQLGRFQQIALQARGPMAFHDADVVAALNLTPEQLQKISAIQGSAFFPPPDCHHGPGSSESPGMRQRPERGSTMSQILGVLTEDQGKRWQQMTGVPVAKLRRPLRPGPPDHFGPPPGHGPRHHDHFGPPR
jgi:hypothetical protein